LLRTILSRNRLENNVYKFVKPILCGSTVSEPLTVDPHKIVEHFNNYFVNIGNNLSASIPLVTTDFSLYLTGSYINSFAFYPTDPEEVISIVNSFVSMGSFGFDDIPLTL